MNGGGERGERFCFEGQCKLTTSNKQGHPTVLLGRISFQKALIISEIRIVLNSDDKLSSSLVKRYLRLSQHGNNYFSLRKEKCLLLRAKTELSYDFRKANVSSTILAQDTFH